MRWNEPETVVELSMSLILMICGIIGTTLVFRMAEREEMLLKHVRDLSELNSAQSVLIREIADTSRKQAEVNRNLSSEIKDVHSRQNILKHIDEQLETMTRETDAARASAGRKP